MAMLGASSVLTCNYLWIIRSKCTGGNHKSYFQLNALCLLSQGRILKHAGDLAAAAALADEARSMDLADRYLNSECVKRMLQADQVILDYKTVLFVALIYFYVKLISVLII